MNRALKDYSDQLYERYERKDELTEKEDAYEEKRELLKETKRRSELIKEAANCLEMAKNNLTTHIVGPVKEDFQKLVNILDQNENEYKIDAKLDLTVSKEGLYRDIRYMSTGIKDMLGITLRIAFANQMYKEEKPMLIFDDPFVNLDDEKQSKAKTLMEEIAKDYQIIYMTCHSDLSKEDKK